MRLFYLFVLIYRINDDALSLFLSIYIVEYVPISSSWRVHIGNKNGL